MTDRASIVNEQFTQRVSKADFPELKSPTSPGLSRLGKQAAIDLFDSQITSRLLDIAARELKEKGLSFYTIGSSGHEGNAAIAAAFRHTDMAFLHYRSGAFYLQRAKQLSGSDGMRDILLSLVASASDPISGGRHKVFGSVPLCIPPQTSTIASHLPKALGAAMSIARARDLAIPATLAQDAVILCSFGDASLNHASTQTTLNACSWLARQNFPLRPTGLKPPSVHAPACNTLPVMVLIWSIFTLWQPKQRIWPGSGNCRYSCMSNASGCWAMPARISSRNI